MKFLKFLVVLTIGITCCMNFTSCSNEEDEPDSGVVGNGTVNPATVFANGIPQKVGGMNLTVNSDGLVSALTDGSVKVTFEYPCMSRANEADVIMNVSDEEGDLVIYVTLNDLGYSKYWKRVYAMASHNGLPFLFTKQSTYPLYLNNLSLYTLLSTW